ncbi:subclass B1 metallo-beta-lactamase [Flammeovirga kamogawensis]|uniref:beta-lactamase n=1 Tax=Flammeovirga kamogawensis TaxID=373891 RepID=A0ABX8H2D4_9BACT|nr:subclass B1 metallo-beta-lactamase [Flammeovirga kamogawensis]MBB6463562.1 metallo-beta-lactamase class B [Flammeovirga kamogawensis]QWG09788.1 subclass B1 metallo-beta-lactamase [Flammeovirga kamogawensis]TRX65296.1 subclass B1 metallo-beta-lactamase [Flammeovirga kamogawensis]
MTLKNISFSFISLIIAFSCCKTKENTSTQIQTYSTDILTVKPLTEHTLVHISYLHTKDFGDVACNGMIVIDDGEAIIIDSPTDSASTVALINYVQDSLKAQIKGVIPTHFHVDCVGGLPEFHKRGIPSYATSQTINLAKEKGFPIPQNGFDNTRTFFVDDHEVIASYFGKGHTEDNIVVYQPTDKVLFGGCLVKKMNAGKGNLADADTNVWASTIQKVSDHYKDVEVVIPGHGPTGNNSLFEYTIQLFEQK